MVIRWPSMPLGILFLVILFLIKYTVHSLLSVSKTTYLVTTPSELLKTRYLLGTLCVNYMMIHTADQSLAWLDCNSNCSLLLFWILAYIFPLECRLFVDINRAFPWKKNNYISVVLELYQSLLVYLKRYFFLSLLLLSISITVRKARYLSFLYRWIWVFLNAGSR